MNSHKKTIFIMFPLIVVLAITALYLDTPSSLNPVKNTMYNPSDKNEEANVLFENTVVTVANLIKEKDFASLSKYIDDNEGLYIKPYYTPGENQGVKIKSSELAAFLENNEAQNWGFEDGSGKPMEMTSEEYYENYIYTQDFLTLGALLINESQVVGNTLPLKQILSDIYGEEPVQYAEYYIAGTDERYGGMDWESLALVFKFIDKEWKLVGIFHNEWTI